MNPTAKRWHLPRRRSPSIGAFELLTCPKRQGKIRILAFIEEEAVAQPILEYPGL